MRMSDEPAQKTPTREHREGKGNKKGGRQTPQRKQQNPPAKTGTLGALFAEALKKS
jgi:hypothetical protein